MKRYYFHIDNGIHVDNGSVQLDHNGLDLPTMQAAREEALGAAVEILAGQTHPQWRGQPWTWRLWMTDGAGGAGETLLALHFSASSN